MFFVLRHIVTAKETAIKRSENSSTELLWLKLLSLCECFWLQMLRLIATALKDVGPCSMFYLAAAVSDFYVPWKSMVQYESHVPKTMLHNSCIWKMFFVYIWWNQTEHKIESGSGPLDIRLAQVPKMLSVLRSNWAPKAFCISFKVNLSLYSLFFLVLILRNPMMYMQILDSAWDRLKDSDREGYKGSKKIQSARSCSQWAINP